MEADYFRIAPTAYFVPVSVKIPGSVITLAEKKNGGQTQFDFVGQVIDERKHIVAKVRDLITVKLPASDTEKLATRNFHYDAGFTLALASTASSSWFARTRAASWAGSTSASSCRISRPIRCCSRRAR